MNSSTIDDAISILSNVLAAFARRSERNAETLSALNQERQAYIARVVERDFLPEINPRVLTTLGHAVPGFVTYTVEEAFATNGKRFFGLFVGANYQRTLTLLRTKLASYLDKHQYGRLGEIDTEISKINVDVASLAAKETETRELVRLLQQAAMHKVPLPAQVVTEVEHIVHRAQTTPQTATSRQSGQRSTLSATTTSHTASSNDDSDIWFYLITDIPTSMRTWVFSAISEHKHGEQIQPNTIEEAPDSKCSPDSFNDTHSHDRSHSHHNNADASAAAAATAICTDDSLGYYS